MANGLTTHALYLSDACLEIESGCDAVDDVIARDWQTARLPLMATRTRHRIGVHATDTFELTFDEERVWSEPLDDAVADTFELVLYRRMFEEHCSRFGVFHAAAVASRGLAWVFCGPSGSGKSSLSAAAVRRGYRFYTDEFVVTDGDSVWGWPRTPHFDPPPGLAVPVPSWLEGLGPADAHGTLRGPVSLDQLAEGPTPARHVHVVFIERGSVTTLTPTRPTSALRDLSDAAFFDSPVSLGQLVHPNRVWRAVWRHPDELLDALEDVASERASRAPAPVW